MDFTALSLDPGGTTGYCRVEKREGVLFLAPGQEELTPLGLYTLLNGWSPKHVICEDFEYRPGEARPSLILVSLELIGVVKLWCEQGNNSPAMQHAFEGKGYFINDKLKALGIYKPAIPHGMDALRHFMHWFVFKGGYKYNDDPELRLVDLK